MTAKKKCHYHQTCTQEEGKVTGKGKYLRLTGECHAIDRDAAKDAVPAYVNDPAEPQATEEAMFEGGEHHLWRRGKQRGYSTSH